MLMTVLKHGGQWEVLGIILTIKGSTFERFITRFASLIVNHMYSKFVIELAQGCTMKSFLDNGSTFENFP